MFLSKLFRNLRAKALVALAGATMVLGVGAAISAGVAQQENEVLETKATTECTVYYALSESTRNGYTVKVNANIGDNNTWKQSNMTDTGKTFQGMKIWSGTFTAKYDGVDALQFQLYDGSTYKSQQQPYGSWTTAATFNGKLYVHNKGWTTYVYDSKTIYFDPKGYYSNFSTPYCHVSCPTSYGTEDTTWPGLEMSDTHTSIYGGKRWSVSIPSTANLIVFSNNGSPQTVNITTITAGSTYLLSSKPSNYSGAWQTMCTLTTHIKNATTTGETSTVYAAYSGVTLPTLPTPGAVTHFEAKYWYTSDSYGTSFTATSITSNTNIYAYHDLRLFLIGDGVGGATSWTVGSAEKGEVPYDGTNVAYWKTIHIANGASFRLAYISSGGSKNWYEPSAGGSAFGSDITRTGGNDGNFTCNVEGYYDVYYILGGGLYFVNESTKATYGYLYMPYTSTYNTSLNIVTYAGASGTGTECISGTQLWSSVSSAISYTSIHLGGHYDGTDSDDKSGLACIPIYDLRGLNASDALSFKISLDGGSSWSGIANLPGTTDTPHVYFEDGFGGISRTFGTAALALFQIGVSIETATNSTLCALTQSQATTLKGYYDAVTSGLDSYSSFRSSTIYTYVAEGNSYTNGTVKITTKTDVAITAIYEQLASRSSTGNWLVKVVPGTPSRAESPLTMTLWIVLASGLTGLAAIGTAYFVSKKKKRPQA